MIILRTAGGRTPGNDSMVGGGPAGVGYRWIAPIPTAAANNSRFVCLEELLASGLCPPTASHEGFVFCTGEISVLGPEALPRR